MSELFDAPINAAPMFRADANRAVCALVGRGAELVPSREPRAESLSALMRLLRARLVRDRWLRLVAGRVARGATGRAVASLARTYEDRLQLAELANDDPRSVAELEREIIVCEARDHLLRSAIVIATRAREDDADHVLALVRAIDALLAPSEMRRAA